MSGLGDASLRFVDENTAGVKLPTPKPTPTADRRVASLSSVELLTGEGEARPTPRPDTAAHILAVLTSEPTQ